MIYLISIIVPVYNVEKYLKKCIQSIINQTYKNLEIILVDDGSSDNSGKICDEFAQKDNRIKVIHKTNSGLSDARNAGLDVMSGEWVSFVDSDDFVSPYYIENLLNLSLKTNSDISITSFKYVFENNEDGISAKIDENDSVLTHEKDEFLSQIFYSKLYDIGATRKLFKKELFNGLRFPKGEISEDLAIIPYVFKNANKVVFCDKKDYFYLLRSDSISRTNVFSQKNLFMFKALSDLKSNFINDKKTLRAINFYENLVNLAAAVRFGDDYKPYKKPLKFKDFIETLFNKNVKFTHKIYFLLYFCFGYKICARIWKFHKKSRK